MKRFVSTLALVCAAWFASAQQLTLSDIYTGHTYYHHDMFEGSRIDGDQVMMNSGKFTSISLDSTHAVTEFDLGKNPANVVLANENADIAIFSEDARPYRRSSLIGSYSVFFKDKKLARPLFADDNVKILNPMFSPDGAMLCFVADADLYVTAFDGNRTAITSDGMRGTILNGTPNIIYEEEFELTAAYEWSPDSRKICYLKFDESHIPDYPIARYDSLMPRTTTEKYSFTGTRAAIATAHIYDIDSNQTIDIKLPDTLHGYSPEYIARITWIDKNRVALTTLNRKQTQVRIFEYDLANNSVRCMYESDSEVYQEVPQFVPVAGTDYFIVTSDANRKRELHLYRRDSLQPRLISNLTKANGEDITKVYGYFPHDNSVRCQAIGETPRDRKVIAINIYNCGKSHALSSDTGDNEAQFSRDGRYMLLHHSELNISDRSEYNAAYTVEMQSDRGNISYSARRNWHAPVDCSIHYFKHSDFTLPPAEWFSIPSEGGDTLCAYMIKPQNLAKKQKCPVYVTTYGGPMGQLVQDAYSYENFWHHFLAQHGYVVVVIDTRGSAGYGNDFQKQTYRSFGQKETYDLHLAAQYIKNLPFVDGNRIAIEGWSFGGYLSLLAACTYPDDFAAVVSINPVVDWRLYDNIYTERYMGLPDDNAQGYEQASVLTHIQNLKVPVLLAYGTADDNVPLANSMQVLAAAVAHHKDIRPLVFPDNDHSLQKPHSRVHLMTKVFEFLEKEIAQPKPAK